MKLEGKFMTLERANQAMAKLKSEGFTNSHIQIDDNNRNIKRNLASSKSSIGLSNLVIDPSDMRRSPLTSISPIINVTAGFSEFNDNNYKIIVETDTGSVQRAKDLIMSLGGKIESEALSIGRNKEDVGKLNKIFKDNDI
jgi:hypothetical protein